MQLYPTLIVQAHYYLALAYQSRGRAADSIKEYERFLAYWGDADIFRDEVNDARRRLADLKEGH